MNIKHNPKIATMRTRTVQLGKRPSAPEVTWPTIHRGAGGGGATNLPRVRVPCQRQRGRPWFQGVGCTMMGEKNAKPPGRSQTQGRLSIGRGSPPDLLPAPRLLVSQGRRRGSSPQEQAPSSDQGGGSVLYEHKHLGRGERWWPHSGQGGKEEGLGGAGADFSHEGT